MNFKTHLVFYSFLHFIFNIDSRLFIFGIIAAVLPDIDISNSKLGKINPFAKLFRHRGFIHSILGAMLLFFPLYFISKLFFYFSFRNFLLVYTLGFFSHLFADSLNPKGVAWFWPLKFRIKGPIKTGSILETTFLMIFLAIDIYLLYQLLF